MKLLLIDSSFLDKGPLCMFNAFCINMADAFIDAVRKGLHPEETEAFTNPIIANENPGKKTRPGRGTTKSRVPPSNNGSGSGCARDTETCSHKRGSSNVLKKRPIFTEAIASCNSVAPSEGDGCTVSGTTLNKRRKTRPQSDTERRGARYRGHPSKSVLDRYTRSLRHRLFLIDRAVSRASSNPEATNATTDAGEEQPTLSETFTVMGVNGNVYNCVISTKPSCDCPDFTKRVGTPGHGPCKHLIFVFIRVLKLKEDDPIWWQAGLLPEEVSEALRSATRTTPDVLADDAVRRQYRAANVPQSSGSAGTSNRKPIEGDCPICYENLGEGDVVRPDDVTTFCEVCGNNFHKTCVQNWTRAKGQSSCPLCRAIMSRHEAPLARDVHEYTNLAAYSSQHARQLTLAELYADTHHYIGRSSRGRGSGRGAGRT